MDTLNDLRSFAQEHGLAVYETTGGVGVQFEDGCDVFWAMPEERWHFLSRAHESGSDFVAGFRELNDRRKRVVEAVRRYLAKQGVFVNRTPNGHWPVMKGMISSELVVGASLTKTIAKKVSLVAAVQSVFEGSFLHKPSQRRAERHLSEFDGPIVEPAWPKEEPELLDLPETPLVALGWMGLCKAIKKESNFDSPEAFVAAAQPKGRVGRALLRLAQRLPNARASVEIMDGSLSIDFDDEYAEFKVNPRSHELRNVIHEKGPEGAGEHLADEYDRLNTARRAVINAVFETLNRHGYSTDRSDGEHLGREFREFSLDLGVELTGTIEKFGEKRAVLSVLNSNPALGEEAVGCMHQSTVMVTLPERPLPPTRPSAIELADLADKQLTKLDERSETLLREFLKSEAALAAYSDPLMWDASVDSWTTPVQWRRLAEQYVGGKYPRPDAAMILIDQGDRSRRSQFLERLRNTEPDDEPWDQEVEMVWRLRKEMPELAAKWFDPQPGEDVPYAEVRARLGDPVAIHYLLAGIRDDDEEDEEAVPYVLAKIRPDLIQQFIGTRQLDAWRGAALQWAAESWRWNYGGDGEMLAVASNMGWPEVGEMLARNPHLLPGLLEPSDGEPGILFADKLLLGWSKLGRSDLLTKLVGNSLRTDSNVLAERFALHQAGKEGDYFAKHPDLVVQLTNAWAGKLGVALAISWRRCRLHMSNGYE